jgi:uncharacterized membrane protein/YHS domain-containing protein
LISSRRAAAGTVPLPPERNRVENRELTRDSAGIQDFVITGRYVSSQVRPRGLLLQDSDMNRSSVCRRRAIRLAGLILGCSVLISAPVLFAQTPSSEGKQKPINEFCPVMTEERVDPEVTTTYKGHTIAFCCKRCLRKFEGDPEHYAMRLAVFREDQEAAAGGGGAERTSASQGSSPPTAANTHEHGPSESEGGTMAQPAEGHAHEHGEHEHSEEGEAEHEEHEHGEHEHAAGASGLGKLIAWLGRFHPPAVNFPIAMLVGAALAELLRMGTKRQYFAGAGRFCLWFGGLGAVVAGMLGWFFAGFELTDSSWIMTTHRWLGTATVLWALVTLIVGERSYRVTDSSKLLVYHVLLFVGAVAVLTTGFFGGAMIYGIDHYAW